MEKDDASSDSGPSGVTTVTVILGLAVPLAVSVQALIFTASHRSPKFCAIAVT